MKRIFNKTYIILIAIITVALNACVEPVDLVTSDAMSGGLVDPITRNVPYKLGATPSFDVTLSIPYGPKVSSIEVYKVFTTVDGVSSSKVMQSTIDVGGANANSEYELEYMETSFSLTYADLKNGITVSGSPLPDDELDLSIGDSWNLEYVSVMSDDSRQVVNNAGTTVSVANFFAGAYISNVTYDHPTAGMQIDGVDYKKDLLALDANKCETTMAGWGDVQLFITIIDANTVIVESNPDDWDELHTLTEWGTNSYDPVTGNIDIYYGYTRDTGTRKFEEHYTLR